MTPLELAESLRAELAEHLQALRRIADQIEAMDTLPLPPNPHWLQFPFDYRPVRVTGEFGVPYTVGGVSWSHEGIDFGLPVGTPVFPCSDGRVVIAGERNGYGLCVRLQHTHNENKWWTWYGHLSVVSVLVGTIVRAGDLIGRSGNTGNTTGPHLHLTVQNESDTTLLPGLNPILRGCVDPRRFVQWQG